MLNLEVVDLMFVYDPSILMTCVDAYFYFLITYGIIYKYEEKYIKGYVCKERKYCNPKK